MFVIVVTSSLFYGISEEHWFVELYHLCFIFALCDVTDVKHWYATGTALGTGDTHAVPAFVDFTVSGSCVLI